MKRLIAIALTLLCSIASAAGGGTTAPICPPGSPSNCVVPNWGQVEPDGTNALLSNPSIAGTTDTSPRASMEVRRLPVAARASSTDSATISSVVSPRNLFAADTARLTKAIQAARFNPDGTIASGGDAITAAAERLVKQAGKKYQLTLYVRVSETLAPDQSGALDKKVQTLNGLLSGPARATTGSDTRG